jgi:DNA replication initiation complex subunit (GINS family)
VQLPAAPTQKVCDEKQKPSETDSKEDLVLVRVLEDMPTFAGVDKDYKLRREDIISLPKGVANTLVSHGKAKVIGS